MTTDTKDDLVTGEMIRAAIKAFDDGEERSCTYDGLEAALRAVAPMIAARAATLALPVRDEIARRDEREACAKIAENRAAKGEYGTWQAQEGLIIATAIRAQGETT
jgi:hypothetical protein